VGKSDYGKEEGMSGGVIYNWGRKNKGDIMVTGSIPSITSLYFDGRGGIAKVILRYWERGPLQGI